MQKINRVQKILNAFYYSRKWVIARISFALIRLHGIELPWDDAWNGKYSKNKHVDRNLDDAQDLDTLLKLAEICSQRAEERRTVILDKTKTLLTISSLMLSVIGVLLPKTLVFNSFWMQCMFFVAAGLLLLIVILMLELLSVRGSRVLVLRQSEVPLSGNDLKKSLINSNLFCEIDINNGTDFLVDLYKAVQFLLSSSFVLIFTLVSVMIVSNNPKSASEALITELRGDQKLIETLKGPKGDQGLKGERGEVGKVGPKGDSPKVDTRSIVDQVLKEL